MIITAELQHAARLAQLGCMPAEVVLYAPEPHNGGGLWDNPSVPPPRRRIRMAALTGETEPGAGVLQGSDAVALKGAIPAIVNHGRWVVVCSCGGAQVASRIDPRFFCTNCLNAPVGGLWRPVKFPKDADAIEEALGRRDYDVNRNWQPPETVADLLAENKREGVR